MCDSWILTHKDASTEALDITAERGMWTRVAPASKWHRDCNPDSQNTQDDPILLLILIQTSPRVGKYRGSEARITSELVLPEPGLQSQEGGVGADIHDPGHFWSPPPPSGCSTHIASGINLFAFLQVNYDIYSNLKVVEQR